MRKKDSLVDRRTFLTQAALGATALAAGAGAVKSANAQSETPRWSPEKAWEWYRGQDWPCGFNYVPANAVSYTEMWMPYAFDTDLMDRELALAEDIGFNCIRVVLPFVVWEHDPAAFKERFDAFLAVCAKRGLRVMPSFFDDCKFGPISDPVYGQQPEMLKGWYANGWTPSPGHALVRDHSAHPRLEAYVRDIMTAHRDDDRVWVWDLYNEPCNGGMRDDSLPLVRSVFEWARDVNPTQPLTIAAFFSLTTIDPERMPELNKILFANSDVVTFHHYGTTKALNRTLDAYEGLGRPMICTEWLNRPRESLVETHLPIFAQRDVGCMHWGLVNGKTQTHLHWGWRPEKGQPDIWQHDLYHGDFTPYDENELALFKQTIQEKMANA